MRGFLTLLSFPPLSHLALVRSVARALLGFSPLARKLSEYRALSTHEAVLRRDARHALAASIRRQCMHQRQRGKYRVLCDGDENTHFFHAPASHRCRWNTMSTVEVEGVHVLDHTGKAAVLLVYYSQLLGRSSRPVWRFDVAMMYANASHVDGAPLVARLEWDEIKAYVDAFDHTSA
ncbi:hypothetical protein D1007_00379 [Hordeum vulgare]|nr:hypothetical protein D1007_00379 [Hordeum vulgare]